MRLAMLYVLTDEELLDNNNSLLEVNMVFGSWLHIAASYGRVDIVSYLKKLQESLSAVIVKFYILNQGKRLFTEIWFLFIRQCRLMKSRNSLIS